ncbi:MAG: helix-turn-helix transcriptional regulator [Mycetocola sp.]
MQEFDVRDLHPWERSPLLDELAQSASVPFRARAFDASRPLEFSHRTRYFRDMELTQTTFDNYFGERTDAQARDHSQPRLVLTFSQGPVAIEQGDRQVGGAAHSIVPIWSLSSWKVTVEGSSSFWACSIPLDELGLPFLLVRDLMTRDLSSSPLGPLLLRHVASLASLPPMDATDEAVLANPSMDIVRALLAVSVGDEFRSREPLGRTLGVRVFAYLRLHVTEPDLTAERIAAHFGISRRYLFTIMRQLGVPMHEWIREERLIRAATMLGERTNARVSVAAIGRLCGFGDHSSFSRAFRQRFGCAPSEWATLSAVEQALMRQRQVGPSTTRAPGTLIPTLDT